MGVFQAPPLNDNGGCFACGRQNPVGLRMEVGHDQDRAVCRIALAEHYQGWPGIAHGGVVAALLDEIMAHALLRTGSHGVTTGMEISYKSPVHLESDLLVVGWVAELRSRLAVTQGEIRAADDDRLLAVATAKFLLRKGGQER